MSLLVAYSNMLWTLLWIAGIFVVATNVYINLLNSPLSYSGCIVLIVVNNSRPIKIHSCGLYREGGDPLTPTCVMSTHHLIYLLKTV